MPRFLLPAPAAPLVALLHAAPAAAQPPAAPTPGRPAMEVASGIEYEEGRYGSDQRLRTVSITNAVRIGAGNVQFSAALPYVGVEGPGNQIGGGGLLGLPVIIDPSRPATRVRRQGLGDVRAAASYSMKSSEIGLSFTGEVKLPTASREKGLGTGAADLAIGTELSKRVGAITPFAGVVYTLPGDFAGVDLRNYVTARAGAGARLGRAVHSQISYGYSQAVDPGLAPRHQIQTSLQAGLTDMLSLRLFGSAGLSESAPDLGAGVQLGFRIR